MRNNEFTIFSKSTEELLEKRAKTKKKKQALARTFKFDSSLEKVQRTSMSANDEFKSLK